MPISSTLPFNALSLVQSNPMAEHLIHSGNPEGELHRIGRARPRRVDKPSILQKVA
jgi:hypothetical protein